MVKKRNILLGLILGLGLTFFAPQQAQAAPKCSSSYDYSVSGLENEYNQGAVSEISFTVSNVVNGRSYQLLLDPGWLGWNREIGSPKTAAEGDDGESITVSFITSDEYAITDKKGANKQLLLEWDDGGSIEKCLLAEYKINTGGSCNLTTQQTGSPSDGCLDKKSPITFKISNATWGGEAYTGDIMLMLNFYQPVVKITNGSGQFVLDNPESQLVVGKDWNIEVMKTYTPVWNGKMCETTIAKVLEECPEEQREETAAEGDIPFDLCKQIPDVTAQGKCEVCLGKGLEDQKGVWTAIGCVDTSSTEGIVSKLMTTGISIAGGIALLMILAAAFLFATSEGEPKRTSEAKEILTSAIIGLIFIIFSVTILQFIGVNILKIPGFGEVR